MSKLNNIRNVCVIGDIGDGKTTLIDALAMQGKKNPDSSSMLFELADEVLRK